MGLGREFARQIPKCYRSLDEIWLIARNTDKLEEVKQELTSVNGVYCRLYDSDLLQDEVYNHLQRDMEALKPDIRILVNAAGFGKNASVMATDVKILTDMIHLNCQALTRLTSQCIPFMSGGSRIVNLASAAAFAPQPGAAVYAATKAYVLNYSRALGKELAENGIFVTAVCPGPVDTNFFDTAGTLKADGKAGAGCAESPAGCAAQAQYFYLRSSHEGGKTGRASVTGPRDGLVYEQNE